MMHDPWDATPDPGRSTHVRIERIKAGANETVVVHASGNVHVDGGGLDRTWFHVGAGFVIGLIFGFLIWGLT